jgi:hypothetical protein
VADSEIWFLATCMKVRFQVMLDDLLKEAGA